MFQAVLGPAESLLERACLPSRSSRLRGETDVKTVRAGLQKGCSGDRQEKQRPRLWAQGWGVRKSFSEKVVILADMLKC